jgi:hypothetical protein
MKKVLAAVCIASAMASTTAFALTFTGTNVPKAGVVASKHNMNNYTENTKDAEGRVCAFCHTPHHSLSDPTGTADYLPLWSHKLTTQTNYVPYFSPTVNVNISNPLAGATMLCMSCHDGVIAVDEHYSNGLTSNKLSDDGFGGAAVGLADNAAAPGAANFANDHPIGFLYAEAVTNHPGDLNPATSVYNGGTKKIQDQLGNTGMFTCATCHDVHNKDNVQNTYPGSTRNYFLLGDNNGSQFCLSCHVK